jgi:hypothetical protein
MNTSKNILVFILLVLTVFFYSGRDIVVYYGHVTEKIENSVNGTGSQRLVSQESSLEEDFPLVFQRNAVQISNFGCESFTSFTLLYPPKLYYPIWLPPDIS